jgi:negative regulator of sigma E activity
MSERVDDAARDPRVDADFERRAKEAFDRSAAELDAATRSRLTQARYRALEELPKGEKRRGWQSWLVPAGAIAAAALVAVLFFQPNGPATDAGLQQAVALGDLEILLGEEDLEMYDEEIEFYAWLEAQPEFTPAAATGDGVG